MNDYRLYFDGEYWIMEMYSPGFEYCVHAVMGNSEADCCRQMFGWGI